MIIDLKNFTGFQPRFSADSLPPNAAQYASECNFTSGQIVGTRAHVDSGLPASSIGNLKGAFVWKESDTSLNAYSWAYDVDAVRGPALNDTHKRFYWTGLNGSTKEFKFARVTDNDNSATPGSAVTTSYKVGVIDSTGWDKTLGDLGITPTVVSQSPPVSFSDLVSTSLSVQYWQSDKDGVLTRDISSGVTFSATTTIDWSSSYTITLPTAINAYGTQSPGGTAYTLTTYPSLSFFSSYGQNFAAHRYVGSGGTFYELVGGVVPEAYLSGHVPGITAVQLYTVGMYTGVDSGWNGAYLDTVYACQDGSGGFLSNRFRSGSTATWPHESLGGTSTTNAQPLEPKLAINWKFTYNGKPYDITIHEVPGHTDVIDIGDGITPLLTRTSTTSFTLSFSYGASQVTEVRSYIVTFLNQFGEESEPSLPYELQLRPIGEMVRFTWDATELANEFGAMSSDRAPYYGMRVYRTASSSSGQADFLYAFTVSTSSTMAGETHKNPTGGYVDDDIPTSQLGAACPTQDYISNSSELQNLQGLKSAHSGMLCAFKGNELWFCEPYQPWAWKRRGVKTVPFPIIDTCVIEGGVYAFTEQGPYFFSGALPEEMVPQKCLSDLPVAGKRSSMSIGNAVIALTGEGPAIVSGLNVQIQPLWSREAWRDLYTTYLATGNTPPQVAGYGNRVVVYFPGVTGTLLYDVEDSSWVLLPQRIDYAYKVPAKAMLGNALDFLFFSSGGTTWWAFGIGTQTGGSVSFDGGADTVTKTAHGLYDGMEVAYDSITTTTGISAWSRYRIVNATTDTYKLAPVVNGTALDLVNNGSGVQTSLPIEKSWTWHSKEFILPIPTNFGVMQLFGVGSVNIEMFIEHPSTGEFKSYGTFANIALSNAGVIQRMPSGFTSTRWSFRISAALPNTRLTRMLVANTVSELRGV